MSERKEKKALYLFEALIALRYQNCSIFVDGDEPMKIIQVMPNGKKDNKGLELIKLLGRKWLDKKVERISATSYRYVDIYLRKEDVDESDFFS